MKRLQSAGYLMNHIARQFAILLNEGLKPLGLSPAQFPILLTLWESDGLSQNELVEIADVAQATIANTLSRMERDGLIERRENPNDARSRLIFLTDRAKGLQESATHIAQNINAGALSALSADEQAAFVAMMGKVIEQQKKMINKEG